MKFILFLAIFSSTQLLNAAGNVPDNYFEVDSAVLRGGALTQGAVEWLEDRGVKTIIKLDDENPEELSWGIDVIPMHINKFGFNLTYNFVKQILDKIEEASKKGLVYVHCEKGADRTGLIIALYRIKSGWSQDAARTEMNAPRFGHSRFQIWIDHKFEDYGRRLAGK